MRYVYPAIFTPVENGQFDVSVPDLPGCRTCGDDLADAIYMAEDAVSMWLWAAESNNVPIPSPTKIHPVESPQFVNYVFADTDEYRRKHDSRAVKKTLSIPSWLNAQAEQAGINFSQVLQEGLKQRLGVQ